MSITKEPIGHIARLARLEFAPEDYDLMAERFRAVIDMVDKSGELDIKIDGRLNCDLINRLREDEIKESSPREDILANAPTSVAGCISVPRIIGQVE